MFHIHWPQRVENEGPYQYQVCRCGAQRVRQMLNYHAPLRPGWWLPRDGWHKRCTCKRDADRTYVVRDIHCPLWREHERGWM